jgi:hypothetical protein
MVGNADPTSANLPLYAAGQNKHKNNHNNQTQAAARVVAPRPAVWPGWKSAQQHQDQEHQKNREHEVSLGESCLRLSNEPARRKNRAGTVPKLKTT